MKLAIKTEKYLSDYLIMSPKSISWTCRHGDQHNSDFVDIKGSDSVDIQWQALENIPAATVACHHKGETIFVSTLNAPSAKKGCLWGLDSNGAVLWHSGVALRPSLTSPCVDNDGNVYVADGVTLSSWTCDGKQRWSVPLTYETSGLMLLNVDQIAVLGIEGTVALFSITAGACLKTMSLSGKQMSNGISHAHLKKPEVIDSFMSSMLAIGVCPDYARQALNRFIGNRIVAKNVPAVHPTLNRLYSMSAIENNQNRLSGIDLQTENFAFQADFGSGCDTSPALSWDCQTLYMSDKQGHFYAADSSNGRVLWQTDLPDSSSASPNVTPDGLIYTSIKSDIVCLDKHGAIQWMGNLSTHFETEVCVNSVLCVTQQYIYGVLALNTDTHYLLVLDRLTGAVVSSTSLAHESVCTLSILPNGNILIPSKPFFYPKSHGFHYFGLTMLAGSELPG